MHIPYLQGFTSVLCEEWSIYANFYIKCTQSYEMQLNMSCDQYINA